MTRTSTIQQAQQIYQASSPNNNVSENGTWIADPSFHETRGVLGKSFAGTDSVPGEPVSDWAFNHMGGWFYEDNKKKYEEGMRFILGLPAYAAKKNDRAFIISKRDNKTADVISAAVLVEYDHREQGTFMNKFLEGWRYFKAFCAMATKDPIPDVFSNKQYKAESSHFQKKIKHFESSTKKWHKEEGPRELHWYVQCVGVSPDYNGKGMGRDLMEKVGALADTVGMTCYLECGECNRGFYEKMGYRVLASKQVTDPVDSSRKPAIVFTMVRPSHEFPVQ
jgi:GNAT superfamily N-acetyltransferase